MSTPAKETVLELQSALHSWKQDPSAPNTRAVLATASVLCQTAVDLERLCSRCECGGALVRVDCAPGALTVPAMRCNDCGALLALVRLNPPEAVDAG